MLDFSMKVIPVDYEHNRISKRNQINRLDSGYEYQCLIPRFNTTSVDLYCRGS